MSIDRHWQYEEDEKGSVVEQSKGYSDRVTVNVDEDFMDDNYGELEIIFKFRGRGGTSIRSRKLKLTSNLNQSIGSAMIPKSEHSMEEVSPGLHGAYSSQDNRSLCVSDEESGCACKDFSPSIFRKLLTETLNSVGLATTGLLAADGFFDQSFDNDMNACAVSDYATEDGNGKRSRQVSGIFGGKKRLLSNASEENVRIQPSKKNPRLQAESADGQESADSDENGERHTCPYFKMFPERYLECGTKDLAQRPKIKSHMIKDHLKKSGIPIPPEIKSQKCEPWERWCKWIIQGGPKTDRPIPNSTPDFYPILNYIVTAASEIPSEGLTCFSSVMLRLFKSIQSDPAEWMPFIKGLEELEQSLNNPGSSSASSTTSTRKIVPSKEEEMITSTEGVAYHPADTEISHDNTAPDHHEEPVAPHFTPSHLNPTEELSSATYTTLVQPPPSPFTSIPHHALVEEYAVQFEHVAPTLYSQTEFDELWGDLMSNQVLQDRPPVEPGYSYQPEPTAEKPVEPPEDHFAVPPGVGTNSKSLVRAVQSPRVRKRKNGTVRQQSVEGASLHDSAPPTQTHTISVTHADQAESFEFKGRFSVSQFQSWLKAKFSFTFDRTDGRKLWCIDVKEDIQIHSPDGIKAHLKTWSTKGNYTGVPSFKIDTCSSRTLGASKWAQITPDMIDTIVQEDTMDDIPFAVKMLRPGSGSSQQSFFSH
ncbi:hypothetical protein ABW19_dt0200190 [Dactylella cylindrospora]|nr:hypothetical protein ABW19_dt0200190 [Dactylella cylindrospora]